MSLATFSIIVAVDSGNGIAKKGVIPWDSPEDLKFFRNTTIGNGNNVVIMGRLTYEYILANGNGRPLAKRKNIIISRTMKQEDYTDIIIYPSILDALAGVGATMSQYDDVFIIGGENIYKEALADYLYLCKNIHVTKFKKDYKCDQFFDTALVEKFPQVINVVKSRDYDRYCYRANIVHDEMQYLQALENIVNNGENRPDRTGVGTRSIFGNVSMRFDIRSRLPIFTTKKVFYDIIIKELLFFISGKTDASILEEQGVKIWSANTSHEFLSDRGLDYNQGDMGPMYGFQWRHFGCEYINCDTEYSGLDQLQRLIDNIRSDPFSRRHVLCNWNAGQIDQMVLAPCHILAQFNVSGDKRYLDCQMYQRSGDMFLGVPFNIASYSLLTYMIAHICNLVPRYFTITIGDAHIYNTHLNAVDRLIKRTPRPFPKCTFRSATKIHEIDDFTFNSFIIHEYTSWPAISAEMAK